MSREDNRRERPEYMGVYQLPPEEAQRRRETGERRGVQHRWSAPTIARVVDPVRGTVVVPCRSKFAALLCAAETWGCRWVELDKAEVLRPQVGDVAVTPPIFERSAENGHTDP